MNVIAVDDEKLALRGMKTKLQSFDYIKNINTFDSPESALAFLDKNQVDVAFLDISMRQMSGLSLAEKIRRFHPETYIIFVTGYSEYALDAYKLHAEGYLVKPVSKEEIAKELDNIRRPRAYSDSHCRITVHTFGNFDVFVDNNPVVFQRSKSKEIFAYLIHKKGSACTTKELAGVLFEDAPYDKQQLRYMQTLLNALCSTFESYGIKDIIVKSYNSIAVDVNKVDCDYYRFLKMDPIAINYYTGEYMNQYSWAEFTAAYLDKHI